MLTHGPTEEEQVTLTEHLSYLEGLARRGTVELAGRTQTSDPSTFGIVVFRAADEGEADSIMRGDPAVRDGVMRAELFPYRVAVRGERGDGPS